MKSDLIGKSLILGYRTGLGGLGLDNERFLIFLMGVLSPDIEVSQSMVELQGLCKVVTLDLKMFR